MHIRFKDLACARLRKPLRYLAACSLAAACLAGPIACSPQGADAAPDTSQQESTLPSSAAADADPSDEATAQAIAADTTSMDFELSERDQDASYDESQATHIELAGKSANVKGEGASAEGSTVTISTAGTYVVSGASDDCQIVVAAGDDDKVQIVLDGVNMSCSSGPCINVTGGDKVFVTLAEGSENTLSDAGWTVTGEADEANATIYSTSDLTLNGTGALTVNATAHHAISSKDDLVVADGTYRISAANDGLRGKDCVKIAGGTCSIEAGDDGIASSNDTDEDRGFVFVSGGALDITAGDDGIQATRYIGLTGGTLDITAGDDAVHSDLDLALDGADVTVEAGDDAFHGEFNVMACSGKLTANACYEGIEGESILLAGGDIAIYAADDTINASAGSTEATDESASENEAAMEQQPMKGMEEAGFNTVGNVTITGGRSVLVCTQDGDSLDSNGSLTMTGGLVLVSGTPGNGNGALDYDTQGTITGGTIIAISTSGMAQSFGSESTQASVVANANGNAGDLVSIVDAEGNVVMSYRSVNAFDWVLASGPSIENGAEYQIVVGGTNSDEDEYGYAEGGTLQGGSCATSATATTEAQGMMGTGGMFGGGGMGGQPGGMDGAAGGRPGGGEMMQDQEGSWA